MMKFDTVDRKPKLYDLAALTAAAAAAVGVMIAVDAKGLAIPICAAAIVYFALAVFMLIRAFIGQLHYNPYSYNTIYYVGFALFLVSVLITLAVLLVNLIRMPEVYGPSTVLYALLNSARNYMLFSAPFILVFAAALCISNISLLLHERRRFVNVLGILLSVLMVGGWLFIFFFDLYASGSQTEVMIHDLICNLFSAIYLYIECMLIGTIIANIIVVSYEPERNKDFIIILGCGLRKDGTPTPILKGRIDRALAFRDKQLEETGKPLKFVTSGGQGPAEANSESLAMKRYLMERGVPESDIIEEDRSTDTFENMKFSKEKIMAADPNAKVAFSTTNYHVFRSGLFARRVKMRAVGMGAKTKWYFWPNASVREFVGLLTAHCLKQALVLGGMIAAYLIMTLVVYNT